MTQDPLDIAYLAGLLDGEGSISCSSTEQGIFLFIACGMNCETPLQWAKEKFGGKVYPLKAGTTFQWVVSGKSCKEILVAILPFLKVKARQAELGIVFCDTIRPPENRKALTDVELLLKLRISNEMRSLNAR